MVKITEGFESGIYDRLYNDSPTDCELEIDETYKIVRKIDGQRLYYFHIKDDCLIKICVYKEVFEDEKI